MKDPQPETSANDTKTKPGKFWLWGLAVIQLPAVMLLAWVGIEETIVKLAGFVILLLCGSMDIKVVKKAGYQVPRWWWGLAVFLPPVYMIVRVCKTDKAPAERVKRFAPAVVWVLLLGLLMALGFLSAITEESEAVEQRYYPGPVAQARSSTLDFSIMPDQYRNALAGQMLQNSLTEQLEDTTLKLDEVSDIVFVENNDATYKWTAKVKLSARMGSSVSDVMAYNLSYDNANDEFSFEISDGDHDKLMELAEKSAE